MTNRRLSRESVSSLKPPSGWEKKINKGLIHQLAESLKIEGLREPIVITKNGGQLYIVNGIHRWAAAKEAGLRTIECVVEKLSETQEEYESKVIVENLIRNELKGEDKDKAIARLVEIRGGEIAKQPKSKEKDQELSRKLSNKSKRGRPKTEKGKAVDQVAKETGKTKRAVESSVQRTETKKKPPKPEPEIKVEPKDKKGNIIPEELRNTVDYFNANHDEIEALCRLVLTKITKFEADKVEHDRPVCVLVEGFKNRWYPIAKKLGHIVRTERRDLVCPWCRGKGCDVCEEVGLVTAEKYKKAPEKPLDIVK